ncbi:hypothetical protein KY289_008090 [Solanum tuberosum]|nr:hypothetical protein KY289_008090 [Solanum tuberosum]
MDSGTTHHLTSDLNNLAIHSEYHGPEEDLATKATLHKGPNEGGLYSLPIWTSVSSPSSYAASLGVWHARLAHASYPIVRRALHSSKIISSSCQSSSLCPTCADDATVPATSTNVAPLTVQIPSSIPQSVVLAPSSLNSVVAAPQSPLQSSVMPTDASSLSPEIPSNTLPTEGGDHEVVFDQSGPLSNVHHPNRLPCSSSKSHPMTTRSQTGSLKQKRPTSYLAMSTDIVEPSCYSQATKYAHWRRAMHEEYNALIQNGTW